MTKKKSITEQIKTYEDACKYNGKKPINEQDLLDLGITSKQIAGLKLEEITLALNECKPTDIYNAKYRHYPYFYSYEGPSAFASVARLAITRLRLRVAVRAFILRVKN